MEPIQNVTWLFSGQTNPSCLSRPGWQKRKFLSFTLFLAATKSGTLPNEGQPHAASPLGPPPHNRHSFPHPASHGNLQLCLHDSPVTGSHRGPPATQKGFKYRAAARTHPEAPVGCNNRGLVVDSCKLDVDGLALAVLPQACVVGPHSEVIGYGFTAVVDVVD